MSRELYKNDAGEIVGCDGSDWFDVRGKKIADQFGAATHVWGRLWWADGQGEDFITSLEELQDAAERFDIDLGDISLDVPFHDQDGDVCGGLVFETP